MCLPRCALPLLKDILSCLVYVQQHSVVAPICGREPVGRVIVERAVCRSPPLLRLLHGAGFQTSCCTPPSCPYFFMLLIQIGFRPVVMVIKIRFGSRGFHGKCTTPTAEFLRTGLETNHTQGHRITQCSPHSRETGS